LLQKLLQAVALVAETVAETVADMLHLLQKLLQVIASSIYCKLQQLTTGNFLLFFSFLQQKCTICATQSATHIYS